MSRARLRWASADRSSRTTTLLHRIVDSAWDVWPYLRSIASVTVNRMVTDDLTDSIWKELTTSFGDVHGVQSVHLSEGWGDILFVRMRVSGTCVDDRDELVLKLKSAVASALGEIRYLVQIQWV